MSGLHARTVVLTSVAALLIAATVSWSQGNLTAKVDSTGLIHFMRGEVELATVELSAHGPEWQHAPQETATGQVSRLPDGTGMQVVGTLPVPNTEDGTIEYTQTVKSLPQGLQIEYDVRMAKTMRLNGLQVSINLPVAQYGGKELQASEPRGEPRIVGLPVEQPENFQIWSGSASRIVAAPDTEMAVTAELRAATDVVIQDLRQWEHPVFEIRFPAFMEGEGREVSAGDRFHLDFTVTYTAPVTLAAP